MDETTKRQIVEHLVHDIFMKKHHVALAGFLVQYANNVRNSTALQMQIGLPVQYPPVMLDLREPTEELVNNILNIDILYKKI